MSNRIRREDWPAWQRTVEAHMHEKGVDAHQASRDIAQAQFKGAHEQSKMEIKEEMAQQLEDTPPANRSTIEEAQGREWAELEYDLDFEVRGLTAEIEEAYLRQVWLYLDMTAAEDHYFDATSERADQFEKEQAELAAQHERDWHILRHDDVLAHMEKTIPDASERAEDKCTRLLEREAWNLEKRHEIGAILYAIELSKRESTVRGGSGKKDAPEKDDAMARAIERFKDKEDERQRTDRDDGHQRERDQ